MPQPSSLDPFALWREWVARVEKDINDVAAPGLGSAEFVEVMNKALSATIAGRSLKRELMNRYLRSLNLPTRSEVEALGDRLHAIEDRLIGMSATLDRIAGVRPGGTGLSVAAPARTKRPPAPMPQATPQPSAAPPVRSAGPKSRKARS